MRLLLNGRAFVYLRRIFTDLGIAMMFMNHLYKITQQLIFDFGSWILDFGLNRTYSILP